LDIAGVILLRIPSKSRYEKMADFAAKQLEKKKPKKRGRPKKVAEVAVKEEEE
jgi:hypothetical protein